MKLIDITSKTPPYFYILICGETPNKLDRVVVFPKDLSSYADKLREIDYDFDRQPFCLIVVQTRHSGKLYQVGVVRDKLVDMGDIKGYLETKEKGK